MWFVIFMVFLWLDDHDCFSKVFPIIFACACITQAYMAYLDYKVKMAKEDQLRTIVNYIQEVNDVQ